MKTVPFDIMRFLDSEEAAQEYFAQIMENGDSEEIIAALDDIARARGMARLEEETSMKTVPSDIVKFLDNEEAVQEYFAQVMENSDSEEIIAVLGDIARARGMAEISEKTGLGRGSLYKALSRGALPRFDTVLRVVRALGLKLTVTRT
ncbi:MAG: putative addiction module antidote protein [Zoogloeaceae bacterium]|jgi:probable addiction module antidote protein|nr:putative addiction module antidote protein [Zoogloeaceae bacterium]